MIALADFKTHAVTYLRTVELDGAEVPLFQCSCEKIIAGEATAFNHCQSLNKDNMRRAMLLNNSRITE